ncbi:hypothetical protein MRX96_037716 [Rhipicephalus microplus]
MRSPDAAAPAPAAAPSSSDGAVAAGARKRRPRARVLTEARPGGMRVASGRPRDDYPALFSFLLGLSHLAVNWMGEERMPHRLCARS